MLAINKPYLTEKFEAKPFVKWAGGKGQLLEIFKNYYPKELKSGKIKRYIEPFLGGGAVLLDILQNYNINEVFAFDINSELINAYVVIKENVESLIKELRGIEQKYLQYDKESRKQMYYEVRDEYNSITIYDQFTKIKKAAYFIFLNKTCYNGLYRVNTKGFFNVPYGDYKNPTICNEKNLYLLNYLLQKVNIFNSDYKESINYIDSSSFVYFDPPYRPLNQTSNFTSYNKFDFNDEDQIELAKFFKEANNLGAKLMLSNSDPKNEDPEDNFFDELYKEFYIHKIMAKRSINSNGKKRGQISEILVTNYSID